MNSVFLNSLVIRNFRSYKDETVYFSPSTGLKLLAGNNGKGKSSLFEAICWVLYGSGIKGSKISSLLAWGQEKAEGTLVLTINNELVVLRRTGPPNKIERVGREPKAEILTQEQVDELIGLPKHRFLHSVIYGQGVALFPDLNTPERGLLLDEVLNLDLWNDCSELATKKYSNSERILRDFQVRLANTKGITEGLISDEKITASIIQWDAERVKTLDSLNKQKAEWKENIIKAAEEKEQELTKLENELNDTVDILADQTTGEEDQIEQIEKLLLGLGDEYDSHRKIFFQAKATFDSLDKSEEFWKNGTCAMCLRPITEQMKQINLAVIAAAKEAAEQDMQKADSMSKLVDEQISNNYEIVKKLRERRTQKQETRRTAEREYGRISTRVKLIKIEGDKLVSQLETDSDPYSVQIVQLQNQKNPHIQTLNENRKQRLDLQSRLKELEEAIKKVEAELVAIEFWKTGFKRIRLYFIQQILASLEIEIKSAISALGLKDWSIKLSTETETKSGTTKLGINLQVTSPTATSAWESWSGGESQRLRLAVALGLGSLIQRAAGVRFTFEVFDEPTNWLDPSGIEDLFECLSYRAQSQQKQIWLIDHRALTYSGFAEIWEASKTEEGTKLSKISEAA